MMRKYIILTFVLVVSAVSASRARAEGHANAPPPPDASEKEPQVSPEKMENMMVAPAPPVKVRPDAAWSRDFTHENYYYPYHREFIADIGLVFGLQDSSGSSQKMNLVAGFAYVFPADILKGTDFSGSKWEGGGEISFANRGHVWGALRRVYNEKSAFRPYYSYGVMQNVVPDEEFGSLSNWDNYLLRVAAGMQDILTPPRSVHMELVAALGAKDFLITFTYGYAWGL